MTSLLAEWNMNVNARHGAKIRLLQLSQAGDYII